MNILKLAIVCVVSWLVGVATYLSSLYLIYGQTAGRADLTAVLFWSFAAALFAFALIYLPILFLLRRLLRGYKPVAAFPMVAALVFVIPTAFILGRFSTDGYGFHGTHSRVNIQSSDSSVNISHQLTENVFADMRQVIQNHVQSEDERTKILNSLDELEAAEGSDGFVQKYQNFIASAANHISLLSPFIPTLTQMLGGS